jgi:hypothetical protein
MSILLTRSRKSVGMAGELARKARGTTALGAPAVRRVGGHSSMIRLSVPRENPSGWSGHVVARATSLAHWMSARRLTPASSYGENEFAMSVWPSA